MDDGQIFCSFTQSNCGYNEVRDLVASGIDPQNLVVYINLLDLESTVLIDCAPSHNSP